MALFGVLLPRLKSIKKASKLNEIIYLFFSYWAWHDVTQRFEVELLVSHYNYDHIEIYKNMYAITILYQSRDLLISIC